MAASPAGHGTGVPSPVQPTPGTAPQLSITAPPSYTDRIPGT